MPLTPSNLSSIDPAVFSPAVDRTSPAGLPVSRLCRPGTFSHASLNAPSVPAEQGLHLGGAIGLRLGRSIAWIAVRATLTLTRAIVLACRPVTLPARSDSTFMIQPGPRAVTKVPCRPAYLRVHSDHLAVEDHLTAFEVGDVPKVVGGACDRART